MIEVSFKLTLLMSFYLWTVRNVWKSTEIKMKPLPPYIHGNNSYTGNQRVFNACILQWYATSSTLANLTKSLIQKCISKTVNGRTLIYIAGNDTSSIRQKYVKRDDTEALIITFSFVLVDFFFRKVVLLNTNNKYASNYFISLTTAFDFILDGVFVIFS